MSARGQAVYLLWHGDRLLEAWGSARRLLRKINKRMDPAVIRELAEALTNGAGCVTLTGPFGRALTIRRQWVK
jgi:hypothetical protein